MHVGNGGSSGDVGEAHRHRISGGTCVWPVEVCLLLTTPFSLVVIRLLSQQPMQLSELQSMSEDALLDR